MVSKSSQNLLRSLPQVEEVLHHPTLVALADSVPRELITQSVRDDVEFRRQQILAGKSADTDIESVARGARMRMLALNKPSLRRVVNASGVVIHTNLGRSVLAPSAVKAVTQVATGYSTLEYDTDAMTRGSRHAHCEQLICTLTGAEAAIAVNNNAAAVMMVLSTFAAGHEAIVSRGELVEIGGSFRIPDIMALSHASMVEVGTTNKTHVVDYAHAITPNTAMLLKVHPSNYRLIGFTESVEVSDLRKLADAENAARNEVCGARAADTPAGAGSAAAPGVAGAPGVGAPGVGASDAENAQANRELLVYEDQGSGAFMRLDCFGQYAEPSVSESLKAGCDLVSFSGDKLLGGPQAGIIVGRAELIAQLKKSPLARALRLDKMTIAALEATLRLYLNPEFAKKDIPTLRMLTEEADVVKARAEKIAKALKRALPKGAADISVIEEVSRAGGGALPMCDIPTYCAQVSFVRGDAQDCDKHLVSKRAVPIIGRLKHEALLFDARTIVEEDEIAEIAAGVSEHFEGLDK